MTDPAIIALAALASLGIVLDAGAIKVEKKIAHGVVHVITLGKK